MAENIGGALKKKSKGAPAPDLPHEIVDEILLLLPAKSILRFRAVCRSWAARLSSPAFTDAYAAKAVARRMHKFVVFAPSASSPRRSTAVYSCGSSQRAAAADPLFTVDGLRTDFLSLSSRPSRGLVLFSETHTLGRYWVCNPSTGECRALPQPRHNDVLFSSAGLAFNDLTMDCKVVHLFFKNGVGRMCEVCTLGDEPGCQWRPATTGLKSPAGLAKFDIVRLLETESVVTKVPPVFADGCLHWLWYPPRTGVLRRQGRDAILQFSATDEGFGLVSAPESVPLEDYIRLGEHFPMVPVHLAELKGLLCMVHDLRHRGQGSSSLDVWVRNAGEWSLDYRIPVTPLLTRDVHAPRFITVLGCYSGDGRDKQEKLLVATSEHKVFALATNTGRVETVFSIGETSIGLQKEARAALWLGLYEDSLVRIGAESHREKEVLSAVTEVLLRLPLKSIVRSKLVCRKWSTLIEGESFVAAHVSMKRPKRIVVATNGSAQRAFFRFAPLESWLHASPSDLASSLVNGKIICSKPCNGLNLISSSTDDYLCNPCTGAIQCLGIRGRSRFAPCRGGRQPSCHAFTVGRNIGFGFDQSTGEHVAVEIGHIGGALACMLKTSESVAWTCAGTPPMSVTDMPPAHVDGTLYWMGEQMQPQRRVVIVAFNISARAFDTLVCEQPCLSIDHGAFLVELNNTLSLVVTNWEAEEMEIWMMNIKLRTWVKVHTVYLRGQPDFSPRTTVVVALEISGGDGRILLSTGRALGYYDTKTGAVDTIYSLDLLQLPPYNLAFPMLCEESLAPVYDDDELPVDHVAPPPGRCDHPEHAVAGDNNSRTPRPVFPKCPTDGCQGMGDYYSRCCKRLFCGKCLPRCGRHSQYLHMPLDHRFDEVIEGIQRNGIPLEHPFVPDPDYYCYYYSATDDSDVVRHVFVSLNDYVELKQPRHLIECAYRMDGHGNVREAWARRCLDFDYGRGPLR